MSDNMKEATDKLKDMLLAAKSQRDVVTQIEIEFEDARTELDVLERAVNKQWAHLQEIIRREAIHGV